MQKILGECRCRSLANCLLNGKPEPFHAGHGVGPGPRVSQEQGAEEMTLRGGIGTPGWGGSAGKSDLPHDQRERRFWVTQTTFPLQLQAREKLRITQNPVVGFAVGTLITMAGRSVLQRKGRLGLGDGIFRGYHPAPLVMTGERDSQGPQHLANATWEDQKQTGPDAESGFKEDSHEGDDGCWGLRRPAL